MIIGDVGISLIEGIFYNIKVIIIEKFVLVLYMIDLMLFFVIIKVGEMIEKVFKNF